MKVLIFGSSKTIGMGLSEADRLPSVLATFLRESFPDREHEVRVRRIGYVSEERLRTLLREVEREQPDYLVLHVNVGQVASPLVEAAVRRRLPRRLHPLMDRVARAHYHFYSRSLQGRPWLFALYRLYQRPVRLLGRCLFGIAPLWEVGEALDFLERLIVAAKRRETMEVILFARAAGQPTPAKLRRSPEVQRIATQFTSGLSALCRNHHLAFVDDWDWAAIGLEPSTDHLPDGIHTGVETSRLQAMTLCSAIARLESPYRPLAGIRR